MGYQLASVIAGGPAPLVATWLLAHTGSEYSIAFAILGCAVVTLVAVALMDDYSQGDIDDDATYHRDPVSRPAVAEPVRRG
jgi:hypothetical protein